MHIQPPAQSTWGSRTDNRERPFYAKPLPCAFDEEATLDQGGCEVVCLILELGQLKASLVALLYDGK